MSSMLADSVPPVVDVVTKGTNWTTIATAVVGGIVAVSGIIGTSWQGERSRVTASENLLVTLRAEADRARTADRRGVYAEFHAAITKLQLAFFVLKEEWRATEDNAAQLALRSKYTGAMAELAAALAEVKLIAPDPIGDAAQAMTDLIADYFYAVTHGREADYDVLADSIGERRKLIYATMRADLAVSPATPLKVRRGAS
jgi:hypothetical protein